MRAITLLLLALSIVSNCSAQRIVADPAKLSGYVLQWAQETTKIAWNDKIIAQEDQKKDADNEQKKAIGDKVASNVAGVGSLGASPAADYGTGTKLGAIDKNDTRIGSVAYSDYESYNEHQRAQLELLRQQLNATNAEGNDSLDWSARIQIQNRYATLKTQAMIAAAAEDERSKTARLALAKEKQDAYEAKLTKMRLKQLQQSPPPSR